MKRNTDFLKTAIVFTLAFAIVTMVMGIGLGSLVESIKTGGVIGLVSGSVSAPIVFLIIHRRRKSRDAREQRSGDD